MKIAITYNEKRSDGEHDAEFDTREAIAVVARMVASLGHTVVPIDVTGSVTRVIAELERTTPDLVFNFAEGERGQFREAFYPALFEQLGLAHTGSSASTLSLCMDKALAKRVVAGARVRVPRGQLVRSLRDVAALERPSAIPVIVKPNLEGSSKGITAESVIRDPARLAPVVRAALVQYPDGVLVEEMIAGVDVGVGWVEGIGLLPPIAYHCGDDPFAVYDFALKHEHPELVDVRIPAPLSELVTARLSACATRVFAALGVEGYGRADFRVTPDGEVVFLEMNPLPSLTMATGHDELYVAAAARGFAPRELLAAILGVDDRSALRRSG
jgi:D-alanine-D-alanine ligase